MVVNTIISKDIKSVFVGYFRIIGFLCGSRRLSDITTIIGQVDELSIVHIGTDSGVQVKITSTFSRRTKAWVSACENAFQNCKLVAEDKQCDNVFSARQLLAKIYATRQRQAGNSERSVWKRHGSWFREREKPLMAQMCTCRKVIATPTKFSMMALSWKDYMYTFVVESPKTPYTWLQMLTEYVHKRRGTRYDRTDACAREKKKPTSERYQVS